MKKLLLSTIVLLAFTVSIILFQLSCKKTADAATPTATAAIPQQNKLIFIKDIPLVSPGTSGLYYSQIWTANYDGTNQQQINITLPAGLFVGYGSVVRLSPDQKTIFFRVDDAKLDNNGTGTYSANIDGTNAKLVIANDSTAPGVEVAY